jgi:IS1 family transposase
MNKLTHEKRCAVVRCLVDGCSVRATVRITGVAKNTIQRITRELGEACFKFQDKMLRNISSKRIQCDEVWCYCYAKDKNLPDEMRGAPGVGSIWTWTALDADTKLIVSWWLGARDSVTAHRFIRDVKDRLASPVQITSDGARVYLEAVSDIMPESDFAMLHKIYGSPNENPEARYSPARCLGSLKYRIQGDPDPDHVSTSFIERQNLNIRMQNRRYTRLTNAFSKKSDMLAYSVAISFMYHNFVRVHQTLGTTPAVAAGIAKRKWKLSDMVDLIDTPMFRQKISN